MLKQNAFSCRIRKLSCYEKATRQVTLECLSICIFLIILNKLIHEENHLKLCKTINICLKLLIGKLI